MITLKSSDLVFFLTPVVFPILGTLRVRDVNIANFWIQCNNWWSIYVLKTGFFACLVDVAAQMADQWAKEDKKETARNKSDESLGNLINGEHKNFFMGKYS